MQMHDGFGSFTVTLPSEHVEPAKQVSAKQVLVVIGGVTFFSLPIGADEAKHVLESVKQAAPNTDPMIVVAN